MVNRDGLRVVRASTAPRAALRRSESPYSQSRTPRTTSGGAVSKPRSTSSRVSKSRTRRTGLATPNTAGGGGGGEGVEDSVPPRPTRLTSQRDIGDLPIDSDPTSSTDEVEERQLQSQPVRGRRVPVAILIKMEQPSSPVLKPTHGL